MPVTEPIVNRTLEPLRLQYEAEVRAIIEAAHRALRAKDYSRATVTDILKEAGLSTRAFYRHFRSKDELLLAMYRHDADEVARRLRRRVDEAESPRHGLLAWLDEVLSLAYDNRRVKRTRVLAAERGRLVAGYPAEIARCVDLLVEPLAEVLERGKDTGQFPQADPANDARSIHDLVWSIAEKRFWGTGVLDREQARAHVLRFCLPALGAAS